MTRSKAPEASISAALSRDAALFERTAPCTYCVRPTFRKDPSDAEKVLSAAREKVHIFENGFLAGEDVDDVERDEDSECDVAEGPETDDLGTPSTTNKNSVLLNDGSTYSGNGKESVSNNVINPQNEMDKEFSSVLSSGSKITARTSITPNRYGAGNPDQENIEIDESSSGEPWVQGLAEGEYSDLSVEERLNALVALIGVANEGNTIRAVLEVIFPFLLSDKLNCFIFYYSFTCLGFCLLLSVFQLSLLSDTKNPPKLLSDIKSFAGPFGSSYSP